MKDWKIESFGFDRQAIEENGNRYIIGNGYLGYRGTLDEFTKSELCGLNLPGLYDQQPGKWAESVNCFNPLYSVVEAEGKMLSVLTTPIESHYQALALDTATFERKTVFENQITITSRRFASSSDFHILGLEYEIRSEVPRKITIYTGIDADIWDINGPHIVDVSYSKENEILHVKGFTQEERILVEVFEKIEYCQDSASFKEEIIGKNQKYLRKITVQIGKEGFSFRKLAYVSYPENKIPKLPDYESEKALHEAIFRKQFQNANIIIDGDNKAQLGASYSIYQLLILAPKRNIASIPARGISGQVYKGAVFWDTEMFLLPFYLLTDPKSAKPLLMYRIHSLDRAKEKAQEFDFEGAFYAWESIKDGIDACTLFNITDPITGRLVRTYFKDKQIHISADIVFALHQYVEYTKDYDLLLQGGFDVVYEVARFYYSYTVYQPAWDRYAICDVTGPDEYHERVNNNAFTNRMVKFCFEYLLEVSEFLKTYDENHHTEYYSKYDEKYNLRDFLAISKKILEKLYIPKPNDEGIIEQFDGYFRLEDANIDELKQKMLHPNEYLGGSNGLATPTKIIKQADIMTMLYLFSEFYPKDILRANFEYYLPKTEHGSSLSACMYALTACLIEKPKAAYPYYLDTALIDYIGKSKKYAGSIYIGGTHPAASGGAYMTLVFGFAGLKIENRKLSVNPVLPEEIRSMEFTIHYQGNPYRVYVSHEKSEIEKGR